MKPRDQRAQLMDINLVNIVGWESWVPNKWTHLFC